VADLHDDWLRRRPVVIELAVDPVEIRRPQIESREPYELEPHFEFVLERLQFLVWSNNYDARAGEPVWWWGRKAERCGATPGDLADVSFNGAPAWCDGGPRQPLAPNVLDGYGVIHRDAIEAGRLTIDRDGSLHPDLATDQTEAVLHPVGPSRIIAPAGSGKTRVLTERLRYLIGGLGWQAQSVCALAYNKRAADEMVERTRDVRPHVRTLNSVALAICNGTGGFASPTASAPRAVIEEVEVRRIIDALIELPRATNTDPYALYIEGLRAIRLALTDPDEAEAAFDAPGLADLFAKFEVILDERSILDFDGQLYQAIRILLTDPAARARAQSMARHLLVDEFQDLTPAHLLLVRLMSAPAYDVFGVGDDDQVIYGFGGATPEFLLEFGDYFPGAVNHALEVNYRCPPSVIAAASKLLSYNDTRIDKSVRPAPGRVAVADELRIVKRSDVEAATETAATLDRWRGEGVDWAEMAVLTRVNSTLLPVQVLLTQSGVPCRAPLDESILERTGTRTALAYLRIGVDPERIERRDIAETVRRPGRRIARNVVDMMTKRPTTSIRDLRRLSDYLNGSDAQKVASFADDLDGVAQAVRTGDSVKALRVIRAQVGLGEAMDALDGSRREADRSTHGDDLAALEQVAALHPDVATFEMWLRQALRNQPRDYAGGVELSTIHRVKGREWDRVVVYGVNSGLLPHRLAGDVAEERRLLHVAITRCRTQCVVVSDIGSPSEFLTELDGTQLRPPRGQVGVNNVRRPGDPTQAKPRSTNRAKSELVSVDAEVGLNVRLTAGYEGEIVELRADSALVAVDGARMTVRFGETVRIGERSVVIGPPKVEVALDPRQQVVVDALQMWRKEAAGREKVPPYVLLSNVDVRTLATTLPGNLRELGKCRGIGPIRLERWGDEILSVIETARSG